MKSVTQKAAERYCSGLVPCALYTSLADTGSFNFEKPAVGLRSPPALRCHDHPRPLILYGGPMLLNAVMKGLPRF